MKKIGIILLVLLFNACQFNQSANKDLVTGAYSRGDGLGSDDVQIEINGEVENRNTYTFGEKVYFIFNDIKGLNKIEGKTYPGLSMHVVNKEMDTVFAEPNLIENLKNGTDLSPLQLQANFIAALPIGEDYKIFLNIWDNKGDGTFSYEMPFEIEANKLLNIKATDINYSNIYLWNESNKYTVSDKKISPNDKYILILEGLDGLEEIDEKVYPILSVNLEDNKGNKIISSTNVLSKYEADGINAKGFGKEQLIVTLSFTKGKFFNPCTLTATLLDKNSKNRIDIKTELVIE